MNSNLGTLLLMHARSAKLSPTLSEREWAAKYEVGVQRLISEVEGQLAVDEFPETNANYACEAKNRRGRGDSKQKHRQVDILTAKITENLKTLFILLHETSNAIDSLDVSVTRCGSGLATSWRADPEIGVCERATKTTVDAASEATSLHQNASAPDEPSATKKRHGQ